MCDLSISIDSNGLVCRFCGRTEHQSIPTETMVLVCILLLLFVFTSTNRHLELPNSTNEPWRCLPCHVPYSPHVPLPCITPSRLLPSHNRSSILNNDPVLTRARVTSETFSSLLLKNSPSLPESVDRVSVSSRDPSFSDVKLRSGFVCLVCLFICFFTLFIYSVL